MMNFRLSSAPAASSTSKSDDNSRSLSARLGKTPPLRAVAPLGGTMPPPLETFPVAVETMRHRHRKEQEWNAKQTHRANLRHNRRAMLPTALSSQPSRPSTYSNPLSSSIQGDIGRRTKSSQNSRAAPAPAVTAASHSSDSLSLSVASVRGDIVDLLQKASIGVGARPKTSAASFYPSRLNFPMPLDPFHMPRKPVMRHYTETPRGMPARAMAIETANRPDSTAGLAKMQRTSKLAALHHKRHSRKIRGRWADGHKGVSVNAFNDPLEGGSVSRKTAAKQRRMRHMRQRANRIKAEEYLATKEAASAGVSAPSRLNTFTSIATRGGGVSSTMANKRRGASSRFRSTLNAEAVENSMGALASKTPGLTDQMTTVLQHAARGVSEIDAEENANPGSSVAAIPQRLLTQADISTNQRLRFRSPALYTQMMTAELLHGHEGRSEEALSTAEKAALVMHLIESAASVLDDRSRQAFQHVQAALRDMVFAPDFQSLVACIPRSKANLQYRWQRNVDKASSHGDSAVASSVFSRSNVYEPAPNIEVCTKLQQERDVLQNELKDNYDRLAIADDLLESCAAEMKYLREWKQKKTLQLSLYQKGEASLEEELKLISGHLQDTNEELEKVMQNNLKMQHTENWQKGLHFGGEFEMEWKHRAAKSRHLPDLLEDALRRLLRSQHRLQQLNARLHSIHHDRDMLLTRIEILEQAVSMMHSEVRQFSGKAAQRLQEQSKLLTQQINRSRLGGELDTASALLGKKINEDDIKGLGTSSDVPVFLRYDGWVRNTGFSKRDAEQAIKKIWSLRSLAKQRAESVGESIPPLAEYWFQELHSRFDGHKYDIFEYSYNFVRALQSGASDPDFSLFLAILFGHLHDSHYYDQMAMVAALKEGFALWDRKSKKLHQRRVTQKDLDGKIDFEVFVSGLEDFFPVKNDDNMDELVAIVRRDALDEDGHVDTRILLEEDNEGYQSNFIECVRDQYLTELFDFEDQIRREMYAIVGMNEHRELQHAAAAAAAQSAADAAEVSAKSSSVARASAEDVQAKVLAARQAAEKAARACAGIEARRRQHQMQRKRNLGKLLDEHDVNDSDEDEDGCRPSSSSSRRSPVFDPQSVLLDDDDATLDEEIAQAAAAAEAAAKEDGDYDPELTALEVAHALHNADPHLPHEQLKELLLRGSQDPYCSNDTVISVESFLKLLKTGKLQQTNMWRHPQAKDNAKWHKRQHRRVQSLLQRESPHIMDGPAILPPGRSQHRGHSPVDSSSARVASSSAGRRGRRFSVISTESEWSVSELTPLPRVNLEPGQAMAKWREITTQRIMGTENARTRDRLDLMRMPASTESTSPRKFSANLQPDGIAPLPRNSSRLKPQFIRSLTTKQ